MGEKFETGDKSVTDSCVLEIYAPRNAQYVLLKMTMGTVHFTAVFTTECVLNEHS